MTDEEFAEAVEASAARQLETAGDHHAGLIDGSVRREALHLVFEFEARKRPGARYAYRVNALPEPGERRNVDGVAGAVFTNWMELVEADDIALPEPSGHAVTWVSD